MLDNTVILCVRAPSTIKCSSDLGAQALDSPKLACLRSNPPRDIPRRRGNGTVDDDNLTLQPLPPTPTRTGSWMIPPTVPYSQAVLDSESPAAEVFELLADQCGSSSDSKSVRPTLN